ncbi:hypothetical protein G6F70_002136 [Rhizopus microsporus]|nr:hypothetical protein G6F71_000709 [Rhizopus microsporus]KAG1202573.1 hypothetical protein G6F70_002136 [Rhizopus microsporus]KAG1212130.1 hypothetical protein G6F69_003980 [Rhizopus microsporus]KAG1232299.1 hypothetical protein G6F67_005111 [Rhizopus microsporus]KAG1266317.1 hypothetical protein G6F68_002856 [Rhizopus microsporus]
MPLIGLRIQCTLFQILEDIILASERILERMVGEFDGTEIAQSECKECNMYKSIKITAKRFAWSWHEVTKGMMPAIKSVLGLKDEQDEEKFLVDLWYLLRADNYDYIVYAVLSRKV